MHSILIAHRGRERFLERCLWSIRTSATACAIDDYEVAVIQPQESHISAMLRDTERTIIILAPGEMEVFNKAKLLNVGIECTSGTIITILDADMLVGKKFMDGVGYLLLNPDVHKLCYRVRNLPPDRTEQLMATESRDDWLHQTAWLFSQHDHFQLSWESYRDPMQNRPRDRDRFAKHAHGNSQFSIRREVLGDLRYDERMEGHGREDLDFNLRLHRKFGEEYRGHLRVDAEHSLLHMWHDKQQLGWDEPHWNMYHEQMMAEEAKAK